MQRGVYSAATAMVTAQQWMDVVSNNLANASTIGFKRDGLSFGDGLVREMAAHGGGGQRIGSMGSGGVIKTVYTDFSPGMLSATGNPLDLAVTGPDGAFAIQTPAGIRYTRDGAFQINSNRQLVTKSGNPVLNRQLQQISVPNGKVTWAADGTLKVDEKPIDQVGVFNGTFTKEGGGIFSSANPTLVEKPELVSGSLETSNVNTVEEMIAMIRVSRSFELAQRSVQSQDDSTQRLISSLQGR